MRSTAALGYASVFISAALYWLGFSMIRPVLPLYFSDHGYKAAAIGLFMALNSILPIVFSMPIGSWIDRIGTRRAVLYGTVVSLTSGVAFVIGVSLGWTWLILLGQVINGIGGLLSWGALQAAASLSVDRKADKSRSNRVLSNFTFVNSLAQLAGPSLGGFLSDWGGYTTIFLIFVAMNAAALLMTTFLPPARAEVTGPDPVAGDQPDWQQALWRSYATGFGLMRRNKPFSMAILLNGIMFMLVDLRSTFFPLYLDNLGLSHTVIGWVLSVSGLAVLIVRPFTGYAINRLGQYRIMMASMIVGGVSLLLLTLRPEILLLSVIMFLWGASTGINQPMALIMVSQAVEPKEQGMGMTIRTMSNRVVQLTNPLFFGAVTTIIGLSMGFGFMGVLLLGAGALYSRQNRRERARSYEAPS
jgi:MFS family permease